MTVADILAYCSSCKGLTLFTLGDSCSRQGSYGAAQLPRRTHGQTTQQNLHGHIHKAAGLLLLWLPCCPCSTLCDPYLNLFRGIIPPLGGTLDFSPILAFVLLSVSNTAAVTRCLLLPIHCLLFYCCAS